MNKETTPPQKLDIASAFDSMDMSPWTDNAPIDGPDQAPKKDSDTIKKDVADSASLLGFTSREPKDIPVEDPEGQINIKAKISSINAFRDLAKRQSPKWPYGYAFEQAVAALERELARKEQGA